MTITTRFAGAALLLAAMSSTASAQDKSPIDRGREVYQKWCAPCHYRIVQPSTLPDRTDLTPQRIETAVRSGTFVMPRFRKTEVSNAELAALSAYLTRNAPAAAR
mgnify:CR=1 FL=1